ncbi:MAG: LysM peptidoglycan-binding domain-containing protein [Bacteroidetes bacterium]|nr:LysM peptidoglycan-binding domain-containing protein [Bacteroidota bacterium]MBS1648725.1 LysM peptidoglycan-binding domain-containing protein [Bacteroidota bacterium]
MNFKKYFFVFVIASGLCFSVKAQTNDYMVHTIQKGETLSMLAKKYNTTVGNIMRLNAMNSKSILKLGEKIKIPVNETTANSTITKQTTEQTVQKQELVPTSDNAVTYTVQPKETLYAIAKKYHVYVSQIKKWNNLKNDNIRAGQNLIVGIKPATSNAHVLPPEVIGTPGKPDNDTTQPKATITTPVAETIKTTEKNSEEKSKPAVAEQPTESSIPAEGYFKNEYKKSGHETMGTAATFKSASGWADKKYYVLMNKVDAGIIVRIASNNKVIYAKVLGPLPDIKDDNGLLIRLSNAAASALGVADRFDVIINY